MPAAPSWAPSPSGEGLGWGRDFIMPPMQHQATPQARQFAHELHQSLTNAERHLWHHLRLQQLGVRFRRQHPLGPFILDFVCLSARLVVEVDGSQHLQQVAADQRREDWLAQRGFRVSRFWAHDVLTQTDAVLERIWWTLQGTSPHPAPPPAGEGASGA